MGVVPERVPEADGAGGDAHRRAHAAGASRRTARGRPAPCSRRAMPSRRHPCRSRQPMSGDDHANDSRRHRPDALRHRWPALAAMLAEAFRGPGERMPIGGLGVIGLVGAGVGLGPALEPQRRRASASSSADNFGLFVNLDARRRRPPDDRCSRRQTDRARRAAGGRVLRADAVRDRRHDADGDGDRPAGHLPRARDPVARASTC